MQPFRTAQARPSLDARIEAQLPVPTGSSGALEHGKQAKRSWGRMALRVLRDVVIAVGLFTAVPVVMVMTKGDRLWDIARNVGSARGGPALLAPVRTFALPTDGGITPLQAGRAFNSLERDPRPNPDFPELPRAARPQAIWEGGPTPGAPARIGIFAAAAKGFSPQEMEYLRTLAGDPAWSAFDLVARAPAVDFIGGRFQTPFTQSAQIFSIPDSDNRWIGDMGRVAVSRAAYHLSLGQRDSAEAVLRAVVSFGFRLADDATSTWKQSNGFRVVGIGRDALREFYTVIGDPRATSAALVAPSKADRELANAAANQTVPGRSPLDEFIARAGDPAVSHAERFESVGVLPLSSCTNVRALLFGPPREVTDAIANARNTLARYPSERAYIDLSSRPLESLDVGRTGPVGSLAHSAASVAGAVLNNPRLAVCTNLLGGLPDR